MPLRPLVLLSLLGLAPLGRAAEPPAPAPDAAALWATHCQRCHGATGRGDTPMGKRLRLADLTTPEWKGSSAYEAAAVRRVIAEGVPGSAMKGYAGKITDAEREALVSFVRGLKP